MTDPGGADPRDSSSRSPFERPAEPPPDAPRFSPPAGSVWPGPPPDSAWAQPAPVQPGLVPPGPVQPAAPVGLLARPVASTGVLAGVIVGCGVLMVLVGLYSSVHQWASADDIYSSLDGGFTGGNPVFGGSNPFDSVVDNQRWAALDHGLVVVGLGLVIVIGGLILRTLQRRA